MTDAGSVVLRSRAARATRAPLERGDKRKPALLRSIQQNVAFPAPTYVPETEIGREAERQRGRGGRASICGDYVFSNA